MLMSTPVQERRLVNTHFLRSIKCAPWGQLFLTVTKERILVRDGLPSKKTIAVDGSMTEYTLAGDSGPVMVLINGFRVPLSSWDRLYPQI